MQKIKLTKRQIEVFKMWNTGLSQMEIARELNSSQTYVSKTLRLVFERLGIKFNTGVVSYARMDIAERQSQRRFWENINKKDTEEMLDILLEMGVNITKLKEKLYRY